MKISILRVVRKTLKVVFAFSLIVSLSAFRHTDVEGYTDPDFTGYKFTTVVLHLPNASLDFKKHVIKQLTKKLKKKNVRVLLHKDLFPPTRTWDEESSAEIYERHNVDAGIVISIGKDEYSESAGMAMYNASTIGGTTTGYVTQTTIVRDQTSFNITIVDTESRKNVWIGELDTRGAGLLFVGNKSTAKSLAKGLVREWKSAGHL